MVLGGEFGVELSGLDIVFFKSVFTNKVIVGELMDGLNGFGVEELSIGDEIDVLVVFEEDFAFGIELFFEVLVVRVGGSEVVVVYVGVFDDWEVVGESRGAVLVVFLEPNAFFIQTGEGYWGAVMAHHWAQEQVLLHWNESLVSQVLQQLILLEFLHLDLSLDCTDFFLQVSDHCLVRI